MPVSRSQRLKAVHDQLIRVSQSWALRRRFDPDRARALCREAVLLNHAHYLAHIPAYQKLAQEEGIRELDDVEPIKRHLMSTDDLFKSYSQRWLDDREYGRMNEWLSQLYHRPIDTDGTCVRR